jgi:glycosyltransferase involved in cell wall biosynthesis
MIRPSSPYRKPEFTARLLMEIKKEYGSEVEITLFGANDVKEIVPSHLLDFDYRQLGKLTQLQVSNLMSDIDIFTDFSSHQAMGLSALEAMASGATVIVPENGGAVEFINHRKNGFVVDTTNYEVCYRALSEMVENHELRKSMQVAGINDVSRLYPERCAYNILELFFGKESI